MFGSNGGDPHLCDIDPRDIRYSQGTVNFQSRNETNFKVLVTNMDIFGYRGNPINVVKMKDGLYTSMDNRRVLAAHLTLNKVKVIVHNYDDIFKDNKTWGQAILERIRQQNSEEFRSGNGSFDRPAVVVSDRNFNALVEMLLTIANVATRVFIVLE